MVVDITSRYPRYDMWRYDCGQTLEFQRTTVLDGTEVQFYQDRHSARTFVKDGAAAVPDYFLAQPMNIIAYLYVVGESGGKTVREINITVMDRPKPIGYVDPTLPVDYSRLLPTGGEDGDILVFGPEGPYWGASGTGQQGGIPEFEVKDGHLYAVYKN